MLTPAVAGILNLRKYDYFVETSKDRSTATNFGLFLTFLLPFAVLGYSAYILYVLFTTAIFTSTSSSALDPKGLVPLPHPLTPPPPLSPV
jgi:hypothetical protein